MTNMYRFQQALKYFKEKVRNWSKNLFRNIFQEKKSIEQQLEDIQHESIISCHIKNKHTTLISLSFFL
jgi:hypothetical protein